MAYLDNEIKGWSTGEWEVPEWEFDGNPALIINHMQMGIVGTGQYSGAPWDQEMKAMEELHTIEKQKKLIAAFRERNLPILFVSVIPNPIGIVPKWGFIYEDDKVVCADTIRHSLEDLSAYDKVMDQLDFRKRLVLDFLKKNEIDPQSLTCIMSRGGSPPNAHSGATRINDKLVEALIERPLDGNPASLGPVIARSISAETGIPAFMYDPITTDEMSPLAKVFGVKGIQHQSMAHVLNTRAMGLAVSAEIGCDFNESDFIIVHIGGGNSVTLWSKGRLVDTIPTDATAFSAERCGFIRTGHAVSLCREYGINTVKSWLSGNGGYVSLCGTNELIKVEEQIENGDQESLLAEQAMAYQLSRSICALLPMASGKPDGIIITGGGAYWKRLMDDIQGWVKFIDAPIFIRPGENEMQALANGAYRVMTGQEKVNEYM